MYAYLSARAFGHSGAGSGAELTLGFAGAAAVCLAATFIPLRLAQRRLEAIER